MSVETGSFGEQRQIPSTITLGGIAYNIKDYPELQDLIKTVSNVEKSKLYNTFDSLKKQIAGLQNVQVVNPTSTEELDARYLTAESASKLISEGIANAIKPLIDANARNAEKDLNAYRERLIKENEDKCIPELVKGNTEEEINRNLAESIRIRSMYTPKPLNNVVDPALQAQAAQMQQANTATQQTANSVQPTAVQPSPQPQQQRVAVPVAPQIEMPNATTQPNVKTMSMQEFAQNRDTLLAQLNSLYGEH